MKKYFVFIGTFLISIIGCYLLFIGGMKLLDDVIPGFINNPPSVVGMFSIFLAIPSLIAYYVAFEWKKPKKIAKSELEPGENSETSKPLDSKKESHWLFALITSFVVIGVIIGLLYIIPPIRWAPYSLTGIDESEFQKIPTPQSSSNNNLASGSGIEASNSANWKTYINSKYGFSIMYPNTWIITEGVSDGIIIFGMGKGSTPNGGFYYGGQSVLVEVASLNLSNLEYIKTNIAPTFNPQKIGNVKFGESVGEKWIFNDNDSDNYAIFFNKNGKRYVIIKESSNKSQFNDYHLEIDQVISTFKFLQ